MNAIDQLLEPLRNGSVTKSNGVQNILVALHDTYGHTFREIQEIDEFQGIPTRTLHSIYAGRRDVPKKFRARFGLPEFVPVPACPVCAEPTAHTHAHGEKVYDNRTHRTAAKPGQIQPWKHGRDLFSMSTIELAWRLENREEV